MFLVIICAWNFIVGLWSYTGSTLHTGIMSKVLVLGLMTVLFLMRNELDLSYDELGIGFNGIRGPVITDSLLTVAALGLMCVIKLIIRKVNPGFFTPGASFIMWEKYPWTEYVTYMLSVVGQEILSRGFVHESLKHILPEKNVNVTSILVSSLLFGAIHIHVGLVYMVSAALLLGVFGIIYNKQHSVWALCIPHFVLGMALGLFDFVAY